MSGMNIFLPTSGSLIKLLLQFTQNEVKGSIHLPVRYSTIRTKCL
jgi:hypothetical protein